MLARAAADLPVSYLKSDGEFIEGLADSETDQLMVQAIVTLAHGLGKSTIAEFVAPPRRRSCCARTASTMPRATTSAAPSTWCTGGARANR